MGRRRRRAGPESIAPPLRTQHPADPQACAHARTHPAPPVLATQYTLTCHDSPPPPPHTQPASSAGGTHLLDVAVLAVLAHQDGAPAQLHAVEGVDGGQRLLGGLELNDAPALGAACRRSGRGGNRGQQGRCAACGARRAACISRRLLLRAPLLPPPLILPDGPCSAVLRQLGMRPSWARAANRQSADRWAVQRVCCAPSCTTPLSTGKPRTGLILDHVGVHHIAALAEPAAEEQQQGFDYRAERRGADRRLPSGAQSPPSGSPTCPTARTCPSGLAKKCARPGWRRKHGGQRA